MNLHRRSFHYLWVGQALANSGDLFYIVAIIMILYHAAGSAALVAFVPFFSTTSRFVGGLVAPWILDRYALKKVLVYSQWMKTVLFLVLILFLETWFRKENASMVFPLICLISFLDGWATPARNSMLPRVVSKEELIRATSFLSVVEQCVQLGGWPVGAILVATFSGPFLLILTLLFFIISSWLMGWIQLNESPTIKSEPSSKGNWDSVKEGWVAIWNSPTLKTIAVIDWFDAMTNVVWIAAILYVFVDQVLHVSQAWWGYINSSFFAGLIFGGLLSIKGESVLKQRLSIGIIVGTALVGAFTFLFGFTPIPWLSLVISFLIGIATQVKTISQQTILLTHSPEHLLPKIFSAKDAILTGTFGVTSLLFGYLAQHVGIQFVFGLAGVLLAVSSGWAMMRRRYLFSITQ